MLCPRKAVVSPLRTGKRSSARRRSREGPFIRSEIDTLGAKEFDHLPPMEATRPVSPKKGASSKGLGSLLKLGDLAGWVQHRTDAPGFVRGDPVPLAVLS
jgi:hypothetical protein